LEILLLQKNVWIPFLKDFQLKYDFIIVLLESKIDTVTIEEVEGFLAKELRLQKYMKGSYSTLSLNIA